jgi:PAS domain S-box-containing protein
MRDVFARILHLEDGDDDAYFVEQALRGDSILGELRRVENAEAFRLALQEFQPDLILADYQLPDMDGMEALAMRGELRPDTPFIFVTGYLGEEVAAGTLKEGATDYVLKDRLTRLPSAVRRALREAEEREQLAVAQASLVRDEHLHRAVAEMTTDFAYSVEIADDGITLEWITGAFNSITGYLAEDATTELLREMVHPDDREVTEERFLSAVQGDVRDVQFRIITRSGEERWLRVCARPVVDEEGRLVRVFGAAQDITKLRDAAAGLEHLSSLLRSTVEAAGAGILVTDLEGNILYNNDLILEMWGISRERLSTFNRTELLQWSATQVKDPEEYLERGLRLVGETDEIELLDGRIYERTINERRANGKEAGMVISARDVTQARRTTTLLAEAERIGGLGSWEADLLSGELRWSDNQYALYGVSRETFDVSMSAFLGLLHPEDRASISAQMSDLGAMPNPLRLSFRAVLPDGRIRTISSSIEMERDEANLPVRLRGTDIDISDWEAAREALRDSEDRHRELIERIPAVVYEAKPGAARHWSYVSPQIETLLGYAPHEWMGDPELWATCLHPEDRAGVLQAQDEHWAAPPSTPGVDSTVSTEYRLTARDGRQIWIRDEAVIVRDESGLPITMRGVIVDVTEEKRAEEDLRHSVAALQRSDDERRRLLDRMFAVQEEERHKIAGDIHDDSVQVMAAAALRLDMLRTKVQDPEQLTMIDRLTTTVRTSIDRLRRLMFELRPPALDREGLAAAVQTYLGRVEEESELDTELKNLLTEEPPERVRLVLYRVVQEAMTNARKHSEATLVRVRLEEKDDSVVATITDNGRGFEMGDSIESPAGHLGISAMRERTTQAGGQLSLRTAPGEGTTVEVRLPLTASSETPPLAA